MLFFIKINITFVGYLNIMTKLKLKILKGKDVIKESEIDYMKTLLPFDSMIGDESSENVSIVSLKLMEPLLRVGNTRVSSKNLLHWKTSGVLLEHNYAIGTWGKFNFIQYAWLQAVKELREFGLPLEIIKKVKDDLIYPSDLNKEAVKNYAINVWKNDKDCKGYSLEKIKFLSEYYIFHDSTTPFSNVLLECIIMRYNMQLIIFKDGDAYFLNEGDDKLFKRYDYDGNGRYDQSTVLTKDDIRFKSYVTISFSEIFRNYILENKEALTVDALPIMNENERELMHHIKRADVKQIVIKYNKQKPYLLEVEEDKQPVDLESRYADHVMKDGHQSVTYQLENGKMVSFSRKTKIKLK